MAGWKKLVHGSLFSGIGGFDLAAEWCGWKNAFHCEADGFCQRVLHAHWPDATLIENIVGYDWKKWKNKIDVLSGGFPCQPFSLAGKRKGTGDERHLWPAMLTAIRAIKPRYVVGENVRGIASWNAGLVFEQVCADLEASGYQVQTFILPAAGIGAPHRRERIFFVAYACGKGRQQEIKRLWQMYGQDEAKVWRDPPTAFTGGTTTDTPGNGRLRKAKGTKVKGRQQGSSENGQSQGPQGPGIPGDASDAGGQQRRQGGLLPQGPEAADRHPGLRGPYDYPGPWGDFPTQSPLCGRDDGLPRELDGITFPRWRSQSLQAYGNAVVPQVAYQVFSVINEMEACLK